MNKEHPPHFADSAGGILLYIQKVQKLYMIGLTKFQREVPDKTYLPGWGCMLCGNVMTAAETTPFSSYPLLSLQLVLSLPLTLSAVTAPSIET